jgi:hypothetical protein
MASKQSSAVTSHEDDAAGPGAEVAGGVRHRFLYDAARSTSERAVYRGTVLVEGEELELEVEVVVTAAATEGRLLAASAVDSSGELVAKAAALVRAAARGPLVEGQPPPRRIHRWRPRA